MLSSFFKIFILITFFVLLGVSPSRAEVSPLIALTSPELLSVSGGTGCDGQNRVVEELKTTRSYQTALGLISQLNCDSAKLYGARALQRICGEQRLSAKSSTGILDCPMVSENREWGEYKSKSITSVSGYIVELASTTPKANLKTNNRSYTVIRVQEKLRSHGCYKGRPDGLDSKRTRGALSNASKRYKGKTPPPLSDSPIKAFFQWFLDIRQRQICREPIVASINRERKKKVEKRRAVRPRAKADGQRKSRNGKKNNTVKPTNNRNPQKPIEKVVKNREVPDFDG